MSLLALIQQKAQACAPEIIALRRHFHRFPELSYQEFNTAARVTEELRKLGLQPRPLAVTGVVAEIQGNNPTKKTIALRADMDALPIEEQNNVPYRSENPGVMHACGHDVHTASLLGTARIITELRNHFNGTVRLIFQPGEEKNPGGASLLIQEGVLQNPVPSCIIGQHVFPLLPAGKVGFRPGKYMASSDEIYITIIGKGGHGAAPELAVDPIVISAHLIVSLQQVVSRKASPKQPTVLTFGRIVANGSTNIIPDKVEIAGTFRTLNEAWREQALKEIEKLAVGLTESMGGKCHITISRGYPCLENHVDLTTRLHHAAEQYLGKENVTEIDQAMGSEDFAYYSQLIPATLYRLGTRNEQRGITAYVHTPTFDVDEDALITGMGLMAWLAISELAHEQ